MIREQLITRATDCLHSVIRPFTAIVTLLATALLVTAPANAEDNQRLNLIQTNDGLYAVETSVNGNATLPFIIDTAAAISAIRMSLLKKTGLEVSGTDWRVFGLLEVDETPKLERAQLNVGPISGLSSMAVLLDEDALADHRAAGLLGLDILMNYNREERYVALDFANLELSSGKSLRDVGVHRRMFWSHSSLPSEAPRLLTFDVTVNGVEGTAILDTGLKFAVMNSAYVSALEKRASRRTTQMTDVHGEKESLRTIMAQNMSLGDLHWRRISSLVADPPVFEMLDLDEKPTMLVGVNFLRELKIVLDRKKGRYIINTPSALRNRKICTGSRVGCTRIVYNKDPRNT